MTAWMGGLSAIERIFLTPIMAKCCLRISVYAKAAIKSGKTSMV